MMFIKIILVVTVIPQDLCIISDAVVASCTRNLIIPLLKALLEQEIILYEFL